jgi:hypothetical protein
MALDEILKTLRVQPFEPFRICMPDGKYFEIRHPDLCMPTKRVVIIGLASDPNDPLPDLTVRVDPLHILRLEPLEAVPKK